MLPIFLLRTGMFVPLLLGVPVTGFSAEFLIRHYPHFRRANLPKVMVSFEEQPRPNAWVWWRARGGRTSV